MTDAPANPIVDISFRTEEGGALSLVAVKQSGSEHVISAEPLVQEVLRRLPQSG